METAELYNPTPRGGGHGFRRLGVVCPGHGHLEHPSGFLSVAREWPTLTPPPSGRLLLTGGAPRTGSSLMASVEEYDPATGLWKPIDPMTQARFAHTATSLPSGKVLITGGHGGASPVAELFDPSLVP